MKTSIIRKNLHHEIEQLENNQLKEVYGLLNNYLNSKDDTEEWNELNKEQQSKILSGIMQADAGQTTPIRVVFDDMKKKYLKHR